MPAGLSAPLPSGTVTFVFTDIEGSTQRWDRDRAAMEAAVRRHDAIMRAAIAAHDGRVFKTIGDAFCAAFARPEAAVAAMLDAQLALGAEDFTAVDGLRVRMAIHTGTADERDDDYFGPAVNRVARLLAIGHGGQVLVSSATAQLVRGDLPPGATLRDLGEHRLKDLSLPERVAALDAPGLPADIRPLRSLTPRTTNLPLQATAFVGREREVAEIGELVATRRLVTLVGSGGIGKTRTSLQVAAALTDAFADGVWFVELAPLASADYVPTTIVQALGLAPNSGGDPVEQTARALRALALLLVLDNCEHLVEASARVVAAILRACPQVKVLASSRQALGLAGEQLYRLAPLAVPTPDRAGRLGVAHAATSPAVELFVERARSVDWRFALTDENAATIADICRRLDGIPLAIELAASRVRILSPRQLRDRLDERFRVLSSGSRDVLPRQQTLRALIDWSHELLDDRERTLFRRLAIFVNGFTLAAASAVASGDGLDEFDVIDLLASLADKSLVLTEPAGDELRYRLLESTRAYASEQLAAAGERDGLAARHARYFRDLLTDLRARYEETARAAEFNTTLAVELEDIRAALAWAPTVTSAHAEADARVEADTAGADIAGDLLVAIGRSWRYIGRGAEGIARIEAYLSTPIATARPAIDRRGAQLRTALSFLLDDLGRFKRALDVADEAVARARAAGVDTVLAAALNTYAGSAAQLGRVDDAQTALAQAVAIPGASPALRLRLLDTRAMLDLVRGDLDAAADSYEQLRRENRRLGNDGAEHVAAQNLAELEHARGQTARALALVEAMLPAIRAGRDANLLGQLLTNLAGYRAAAGDLAGAASAAREAIASGDLDSDHAYVPIAIEHFALVCALRDDCARAATLEGYVAAWFDAHGFEREHTEKTTHDRLIALLRERLTPAELARRTADGAALTPPATIALALAAGKNPAAVEPHA